MIEFLLTPMADAFMQVGVWVAVLGVVFGWLRWRHGDWLTGALRANSRLGPLAGALLGVSPGCAGALLMMPLYAARKVSFGTVVAALAATMGDASWVIIAGDPGAAVGVHAALFAVGLTLGHLVDALGLAPHSAAAAVRAPAPMGPRREGPGAAIDPAFALPTGLGRAHAALWLVAGVAAVVAVPVTFQLVDPAQLSVALGGFDLYLVLGAAGTTLALVLAFGQRRSKRCDGGAADRAADCAADVSPASLAVALREGAHEMATVVTWVTGAFVAWHVVQAATGFDPALLPFAGLVGVLAGALIGLVPGCAAHIVVTGLYVAGAVPVPALLANAVSQDGDALLPLLALDRRAALAAGAITTVPAVLVGGAALFLIG